MPVGAPSTASEPESISWCRWLLNLTQSGHDGSASRGTQLARQDRCVPRRSKCALTVRNGQGPEFSSPNQPDQERTMACRDSSGPESRSDAHCATIVGGWEEPSGENPDSNKEKQIWAIREKRTKARGSNRKRPSSIKKKNGNRKKKRRNKCSVLSQQFGLCRC